MPVDALLHASVTLPSGATSTAGTPLEIGGVLLDSRHRITVTSPALTTSELPDGESIIVGFEQSADGENWEPVVVLIEQTGADGAGAAAATQVYALPSDASGFLRLFATNSGAGDASLKTATARFEF